LGRFGSTRHVWHIGPPNRDPFCDGSLAMRTLALTLVLCSLAGCGDLYRYFASGEVGWALKQEVRDKRSSEIAIAKLTRFEWDELFLFAPYQPTSQVCERLALSPEECRATIKSESTDDGEMLIVLRQKGRVVHSEMHSRWHGDFTPVPDKPLTPASAVFVVEAAGQMSKGEWLRLRPTRINPNP
jgi:hypothetical protein